jgi:excinuclease UvrABC ATPase subunit
VLKELRDLGNTVVVVEHDEMMMRDADYIIDMGPWPATSAAKWWPPVITMSLSPMKTA